MNTHPCHCKNAVIKEKARACSEDLLRFLAASPTAWQAVATAEKELQAAGFSKYEQVEKLSLQPGCKGYFTQNDSALLAFHIGEKPLENGFRVFGAHSDSPSLKIKPQAVSLSEGVLRLNVEVYGGPLLYTYFDRPLSLAGRVALRGSSPLEVEMRLIDFKKPILILPNLAIHMENKSNNGQEIAREKDILPFISLACNCPEDEQKNFLNYLIAEELGCAEEDILDFELMVYEVNPPSFCGVDDCFISSGRLDNLAMFKAGLNALTKNASYIKSGSGIKVLLISDNEEVGSRTKQGANGLIFRDLLERIVLGLGGDRENFLQIFSKSFMISADLAHAAHPNFPEKADPDHRPRVNGGPVIKLSASQSYASDAYSSAVFEQLADAAGVPCQKFVNKSNMRGGSTIGPLGSSIIPMPTVDCGNAIWGMHSLRETGGSLDQYYLEKLVGEFFAL